jgi:3-deoxy-manno-octulosonate cytidylyltransferase (CMP-KDO synthetase)
MRYKVLMIVPARFDSSRFPGKPLALIGQKTMIQRVWEQCRKVEIDDAKVLIATDNHKILETCKSFGAEVVMTSVDLVSGTDRCFEAALNSDLDFDIMVNVQGDEPFINPINIKDLVSNLLNSDALIGTLKMQLDENEDFENINIVKVVTDYQNNALYFSRSAIPYKRNKISDIDYFKHIGIYAFKKEIISRIRNLTPSFLEKAESLEQLRWLENGYKIAVYNSLPSGPAVDTPKDLESIQKWLINNPQHL